MEAISIEWHGLNAMICRTKRATNLFFYFLGTNTSLAASKRLWKRLDMDPISKSCTTWAVSSVQLWRFVRFIIVMKSLIDFSFVRKPTHSKPSPRSPLLLESFMLLGMFQTAKSTSTLVWRKASVWLMASGWNVSGHTSTVLYQWPGICRLSTGD